MLKTVLKRYKTDKPFKAGVALVRGAGVDAVYAIFRLITGIIYSSIWFITLAVYHLVLGVIRLFLLRSYGIAKKKDDPGRTEYEFSRYRIAATAMLALEIPVAGMATLTVITNSGFSYPGYVIYASAAYTFYIATTAIINVVKYRRIGSPVLSAAKAVNLVSAAVSLFGLQTAMIASFSEQNETFRFIMNSCTGAAVITFSTAVSVYMLICYAKFKKQRNE